ncbi:MAG: NADPH-dependent oxidoreductase [Actinomycetia bacterium]|nr:NADPH-dependent oxidoreductase [Actinomycetes bacterium]
MSLASPPLDSLLSARFAGRAPERANQAEATSTISEMLDHRVCRTFSDQPVDDATLDLVLAATFSTPSKSDFQQCSVILVDDHQRRAAIAALIPTMPWIAESARFLVFCADSRRLRSVADAHGRNFANDHLDAVLNAAADAAMHLSSFIWAAESMGLGTCPISVVRNHIDEVSAVLELPDHVFPLAGMCVGWKSRGRWVTPRLPLEVTVHRDRYDDRDARSLISDYDERRVRQAVEGGGAEEPGWSVQKAEMVANCERDQLARHLRAKGFGLG